MSTSPTDGEKWEFNEEVTRVFSSMLERSIPAHAQMRNLVTEVAKPFIDIALFEGSRAHVHDLGTSRGDALAPLVADYKDQDVSFNGCEISAPMLDAAQARFKDNPNVKISALDLRTDYPGGHTTALTLAILTLQFVPIEHRQRIIRSAFDATRYGGALILVEKVLGNGAGLDSLFVAEYLRSKALAGYTEEEIERKRLALEGVLVPVTSRWNAELLERAGFTEVDEFWRVLNFCGWIAVKT